MVVTYRNNRLVPAAIVTCCLFLVFWLVDPSVENYGLTPAAVTVTDNGLNVQPQYYPPAAEEYKDTATAAAVTEDDDYREPLRPALSQGLDDTPSSPHSVAGAALSPDDIVLVLKTGGTTMWKRLLVHLTTTLARERISPASVAIYSDETQTIGRFAVVDALANMSAAAHAADDFDVYRQQPEYAAYNHYVEASGVGGDAWGPTGGWTIDKYKFIPLLQHAGENWPRAKWYVYMEDDTYLFLPAVLAYLSRFDHRRPHYLGSYAAKSDVVFAHGGAGFALSRGAWEASFGRTPNMTDEYYDYTAAHCCGDQVLARALVDHGVHFGENGGDGLFTWGFNPLVHWAFAFSRHNWCSPLLSWHKVHSRDVAQYYELERSWDWTKPLLHRDFFTSVILPRIQQRLEWWDNLSGAYEMSSGNREWAAAPPPAANGAAQHDAALWRAAWASPDACEAACRSWPECVQWSFVEDLCRVDDKAAMGQGYAPGMSERRTSLMHTSGWLTERLGGWACR